MKNAAVSCPGTDRRCNANGFCDITTGICNCYTGMQGLDCSGKHFLDYVCTTDKHPKTHIANISEIICPGNCSNAGSCDTSSGQCLCNDGRHDMDCSSNFLFLILVGFSW